MDNLYIDYQPISNRQQFDFIISTIQKKVGQDQEEMLYKQSYWLQLWVRPKPKWLPERAWRWLLSKLVVLRTETEVGTWIKETP